MQSKNQRMARTALAEALDSVSVNGGVQGRVTRQTRCLEIPTVNAITCVKNTARPVISLLVEPMLLA